MYNCIIVFLLVASGVLNSVAAAPAPSCPSPAPVKGQPALDPVMKGNFADPAIIEVDGIIYTFATTSDDVNVPVASQADGKPMQMATAVSGTKKALDALPTLPAWSTGGIWAPHVLEIADGNFVMYYSAVPKENKNKHCVGTATSSNVTGPYVPVDTVFACPKDSNGNIIGAIDPSGFVDVDKKVYVVYKVDGNSQGGSGPCGNMGPGFGKPTPLMLQEVEPKDGVTQIGQAVEILNRSDSDGPLVEAPSLLRSPEGTYILFFSSQCYSGPDYDTSYATSQNLKGPYTKSPKPLLLSGMYGGLMSPGGTSVNKAGDVIVFHADASPCDPGTRQLYLSSIKVSGNTVELINVNTANTGP